MNTIKYSQDIPTIHSHDSVEKIKSVVEQSKTSYVPIINKHKFLGFISKKDINQIETIKSLKILLLTSNIPVFTKETNILKANEVFSETPFDLLPVIENNLILGFVIKENLLLQIIKLMNVENLYHWLEVEIPYTISALPNFISYLERTNSKILSFTIIKNVEPIKDSSDEDEENYITIGVHLITHDATHLELSLAQQGYHILYQTSDGEENNETFIKERAEEFLRYLEI